jgi:hypothetical protein
MGGISTMRAWKPGVLGFLMSQGRGDLRMAMETAREAGSLVDEQTVHNLVVTNGKNWLAMLLGNLAAGGITYQAFGTGTTAPAAGDVQLTAEVARMPITLASVTVNVLTLDAYYTAANCNYAIQEVGWFGGPASGAANSGELISHYLQPYNNSGGSPNDLTFEYIFTFS